MSVVFAGLEFALVRARIRANAQLCIAITFATFFQQALHNCAIFRVKGFLKLLLGSSVAKRIAFIINLLLCIERADALAFDMLLLLCDGEVRKRPLPFTCYTQGWSAQQGKEHEDC